MSTTNHFKSSPERVSYVFVVLTFALVGWLHLATPLLAALFSYFALTKLHFEVRGGKWIAITLFLLLASAAGWGMAYFTHQSVDALPKIADEAIPSIARWAAEYQIELPFTDFEGLKTMIFDTLKEETGFIGKAAHFARVATTQVVFLIIGVVVAISVFLNAQMELDRHRHAVKNNLYSICCDEIAARFGAFYQSFATVMGAQMAISAINTVLTLIFVLSVRMPHPVVVTGVTFLCGLLPVVGNLLSNTIIVAIAFTVSPKMALTALVFLVAIHKLEYFLNSKIIGARIRNPIWLTLLGLIIGEKLMGVPGMILAPVVLNYVKVEASRIEVKSE
ncbi:MAG: AI-2E family transporter [Verrucomicrobia bacterium]|nr:AI-2E family transporter [Verrucomicrobiota bacterium]